MRKLLYVNSSPRGERSESRAIADEYLRALLRCSPDVAVELLDLWTEPLPVFAGKGVAAKMSVFAGQEPSGEEGDAWAEVRRLFERFDAADEYLFTVPMWNHSVPWVLKHLIDTISQPGMVFGFDPGTGYSGLLEGKRAVVVYTSAVYYPGAPLPFGQDFHRALLQRLAAMGRDRGRVGDPLPADARHGRRRRRSPDRSRRGPGAGGATRAPGARPGRLRARRTSRLTARPEVGSADAPGRRTRRAPAGRPGARGAPRALNEGGYWAEIVDREWRGVYMTDEARWMFGGRIGLAPYPIGAHFFGAERVRRMTGMARRPVPDGDRPPGVRTVRSVDSRRHPRWSRRAARACGPASCETSSTSCSPVELPAGVHDQRSAGSTRPRARASTS